MQKGNFIQRVLQFAERKGFYMILGLCVVAIGVSTYVLFFTAPQPEPMIGEAEVPASPKEEVSAAGNPPDLIIPKQDSPVAQEPPVEPEEKPSVNIEEAPVQNTVGIDEKKPSNSIQVSAPADVKEDIFTLPVQAAEVQREYSGEMLVFDPTMQDWRTHGGTDFSCDEGDTVMAVLDGAVTEIYEDAMRGHCIRIDHGAELESLYCGVIALDHLKVGTTVSAGQTIGRAGNSVLSESAQECHVHLEMTEEGVSVDPMSILK